MLEEAHRRRRGERIERVDLGRSSGFALGGRRRDLVDQLPDPLVIGRPRPDDHLLRVGPQAHPRLGHLRAENRRHRRRRHSLDRIDFHRGSRRRPFGVDLLQDGGDRFVLGRSGPDSQLLGCVWVEGHVGLRHGRGDYLHRVGCRRGLERIDDDSAGLFGHFLRQLIDQAGDLLVDLRRRPGHELVFLSTDGEPCLRDRFGQEAGRVDGSHSAHALERVDNRLGVFGLGAFHVDGGERALDHVVVAGSGPGDHLIGVGSGSDLGLRRGQLEDLDRTGRVDGLQTIEGRRGRDARGGLGRHLLDHGGDLAVVGLSSPRQDGARGGVGDELHVGHLLLEHLDRQGGVDVGNRIRGELLLQLVRHAGVHLVDRRLDRFVLGRAGPDHQPPRLRVEDELGVGEQPLEHREHALRIGRLDRIDAEAELTVARRAAGDLLDNLGNDQVLGRLGPDGQLAGFAVGDDLRAR